MKITPVLIVERIETSLPFWTDRMGFQAIAEVPDGNHLGFALLARNGAELMLQTIESLQKDEPKFAPQPPLTPTSLFIEVDDFPDLLKRLEGYPVAMPERDTFYGMHEIGVFEPGGHIIVFATPKAKA